MESPPNINPLTWAEGFSCLDKSTAVLLKAIITASIIRAKGCAGRAVQGSFCSSGDVIASPALNSCQKLPLVDLAVIGNCSVKDSWT